MIGNILGYAQKLIEEWWNNFGKREMKSDKKLSSKNCHSLHYLLSVVYKFKQNFQDKCNCEHYAILILTSSIIDSIFFEFIVK